MPKKYPVPLPPLDPSADVGPLARLTYNYLRSRPLSYYTMAELIFMDDKEFENLMAELDKVRIDCS